MAVSTCAGERGAAAVKQAEESLRPVSVGCGVGEIDFNISQRTLDAEAKCGGELNPDGAVDRRVKVLRIDNSNAVEPMAVIMHVVCHPNVFRGENDQVSGDFVGLGRVLLERNFNGKTISTVLQGPPWQRIHLRF